MTIADKARESAIPCEMVLYAYRKNKDGVVVSFVVHPDDVPDELATAPIGARYVVAMVRVGDDEMPVPAKTTKPDKPSEAKRTWDEFQPAQQAGIRSNDIRFVQFLEEEYPNEWREHQEAADCIRSICAVHSRSELGTNQKARVLWNQLDKHYQAWDAKVRFNS